VNICYILKTKALVAEHEDQTVKWPFSEFIKKCFIDCC
jgi:hypothetical protein